MLKIVSISIAFALLFSLAEGKESGKKFPVVSLHTSKGIIKIELYPDRAPITVSNFLHYVNEGFYDGLIFHRVIKGFMVQGGGFTPDMKEKTPLKKPIKNEAGNGLKNMKGTISMARTMGVDSATAQFFINVVDNSFLDHRDETPRGFGYAVFGKVTKGMDVVDKIVASPTHTAGMHSDVPIEPIVIQKGEVSP
jgi:cyclophilin family peptidyl-prolyl cis-trans isomerase